MPWACPTSSSRPTVSVRSNGRWREPRPAGGHLERRRGADAGPAGLAALGRLRPRRPGRRAVAWRDEGAYAPGGLVFDVGIATTAALHELRSGTAAEAAGAVEAKGNGSLMRILPLPLVYREVPDPELLEMAFRASRVTHGSAEAQLACGFYALIVRRLLEGDDDRAAILAGARAGLREHLRARGLPGSKEAASPAQAAGRARRVRGLERPWWEWPRRGQLLVGLGRLRGCVRLRLRRDRCRALRARHRHHCCHRRRSRGGGLRHRGGAHGLAARPARSSHGPGARRPARRDRSLRVGRHAMADVASPGLARRLHGLSRARTWPTVAGGQA